MRSDNFDSVTNNLRNSANGTFVTSDDTFPLTELLQSLCHLLPLVKLLSSDVPRLEQHKTSGEVLDDVNMPVSENGQVFCLSEELSIG